MSMTGRASVFTISGDVQYSGLAVAADQNVSEFSDSHEANLSENKNGLGELIGFHVADKRLKATITFYPDSNSVDGAKAALKYPDVLVKVTLSNFPDTATPSLLINGDWIYKGGASRSFSEGQARFTLPIEKPLTSAYTVDQLVAAVS